MHHCGALTTNTSGETLLEVPYFLFPCLDMGSFSHDASRVRLIAPEEVMPRRLTLNPLFLLFKVFHEVIGDR